jgi:hypothetical protein
MTREQAVKIVADSYVSSPPGLWRQEAARDQINALIGLGLLKFETTTEDEVRIAAAKKLEGKRIDVRFSGPHNDTEVAQISWAGALEILDILIKSGFRVMRDTPPT